MRILIVDDEPAMHDSYRRCLAPASDGAAAGLDAMAAELFGDEAAIGADDAAVFDCVHLHQGLDAVAAVEHARVAGNPFAIAFIDVRMPPGIDGKETATRIRAIDPDINLVIVTGYSDFSPVEISKAAGPADKIFYIAKPFEVAEITQTATALTKRWASDRELRVARETLAAQVVQLEQQSAELAANESRAIHLANHDMLTEAPNRLAFQRALAERARASGTFAVAMFDLDRFKLVNDTLGHLAGDELIRHICAILQANVPSGGLVARLGGDEFGMLFDTAGDEAAVMACDRVVAACSTTMTVFGHSVQGSASAGVVTAAEEGKRDPVDLLRRADLALNDAKRQGRNVARLFDEDMDESIRMRRRIENGLSQAIANDELALVYQPIIARERLEVVGFEALLRWNHPKRGVLSPPDFFPAIKRSNLSAAIDEWVINSAVARIAELERAQIPLMIAVNVSLNRLETLEFPSFIRSLLNRWECSPHLLQIEATEDATVSNPQVNLRNLGKLTELGVSVAIDDFGTGYSNLANLIMLPVSRLKIDQSLLKDIEHRPEAYVLVQTIISLANSLGFHSVAEGVETERQMQILQSMGCDVLQGFLFSRPVTFDQLKMLHHSFTGRVRRSDLRKPKPPSPNRTAAA